MPTCLTSVSRYNERTFVRAGAVAARLLDARPRCRHPVKHGRIPCLGALFRTTRSRDTDERACRTGDLNPERGHAGDRALTRRGLVERTRSADDGRGQQTLIAAYPPQLQSVRTRVMWHLRLLAHHLRRAGPKCAAALGYRSLVRRIANRICRLVSRDSVLFT